MIDINDARMIDATVNTHGDSQRSAGIAAQIMNSNLSLQWFLM